MLNQRLLALTAAVIAFGASPSARALVPCNHPFSKHETGCREHGSADSPANRSGDSQNAPAPTATPAAPAPATPTAGPSSAPSPAPDPHNNPHSPGPKGHKGGKHGGKHGHHGGKHHGGHGGGGKGR